MKDSIPTFKSLIKHKIHQKNLSHSDLVSAIGYTNITKGTRRINNFLNTLETPSEKFIAKLLSVLDIDCITFNRSINASLDQFSNQAKKNFKPYIQIILDIEIRPLFASQAVKNKCSIPVSTKPQNQPFNDELEAVITIYKNHIATILSENISKHIIGFKYHRQHNYFMNFDAYLMMKEIVFLQPLPSGKVLLENRMNECFWILTDKKIVMPDSLHILAVIDDPVAFGESEQNIFQHQWLKCRKQLTGDIIRVGMIMNFLLDPLE